MKQGNSVPNAQLGSFVAWVRLSMAGLMLTLMTGCSLELVGEIPTDPVQLQEALFQAAKWEGPRRTQALIEAGARADAREFNGWTPLHYAINRLRDKKHAKVRVVKVLIESDSADVSAITNDGETPVGLSVQHGAIEVLDLLLEHGADVITQSDGGLTPLMVAVGSEDIEMAQHLLEIGVDVNEQLPRGGGALHVATSSRNLEAMRLLFEYGADVDGSGKSSAPIIFAAALHHENVVKLLLEAGADVNAINQKNGMTALHRAVESGPVMVKLLLAAGANVNVLNRDAQTPLSIAEQAGDPETISLLSTGS